MIQIVDPERCTACNICVSACPTNVFDAVPDGPPVIARQKDCQTCFMCELYCPEDALYVSPFASEVEEIDLKQLRATGVLGNYRSAIGWSQGSGERRASDASFQLLGR
jgi:NAD-dependent dihydropyrimidine dehydrogenase PreA subunit